MIVMERSSSVSRVELRGPSPSPSIVTAVFVATSFEAQIRPRRGALYVQIVGRLDGPILADPHVAEALESRSGGVAVLDLSRAEAVDSRGLEALEERVVVMGWLE